MDLQSLFGDAQAQASQVFSDVQNVGVPALKSAAEGTVVNWLQGQQAQDNKTLSDNVQSVLSRPPSAPGSFSANLVSAFQNPVVKQYGPMILVGVVVLFIVARGLK